MRLHLPPTFLERFRHVVKTGSHLGDFATARHPGPGRKVARSHFSNSRQQPAQAPKHHYIGPDPDGGHQEQDHRHPGRDVTPERALSQLIDGGLGNAHHRVGRIALSVPCNTRVGEKRPILGQRARPRALGVETALRQSLAKTRGIRRMNQKDRSPGVGQSDHRLAPKPRPCSQVGEPRQGEGGVKHSVGSSARIAKRSAYTQDRNITVRIDHLCHRKHTRQRALEETL